LQVPFDFDLIPIFLPLLQEEKDRNAKCEQLRGDDAQPNTIDPEEDR